MTLSRLRLKPKQYQPGPFDLLSEAELAILFDRELPPGAAVTLYEDDGIPAALWKAHRAAVLDAWVKDRPGSRPSLWWKIDAPRWQAPAEYEGAWFVATLPEPRLRLGGTGVTTAERWPAIVPSWSDGIPDYWHEIDADDPPMYEAQASYLRRHGLLLPGELERLSDADFEPVAVE